MKVKKYVAPTMAQAMNEIRSELGNDAVILNSKVIHSGGFMGLFKKRNFEVVAAIDPMAARPQKPLVKEKPRKAIVKKEKKPEQNNIEPAEKISRLHNETPPFPAKVMHEISQLKQMLSGLSQDNALLKESLPEPIRLIDIHLQKIDVDLKVRQALVHKLLEKWYSSQGKAAVSDVKSWAREELKQQLAAIRLPKRVFTKKFINVVGPTGVGKTTTLAKIASEIVLKQQKKIAFITTDTYRIGAIEQLKTYAQILGVPLEVAYNAEDFSRASKRFAEYDHIFVDTAGRNFRNQSYVQDLKGVIQFQEEMETYLVLSLTSRQSDMEDIFRQFSILPINGFIFTKADETACHGAMLNVMLEHQMGAAFLASGQNVPDDIEEATPDTIIKTLFGDMKHEGSS
ncbi:flagellar biosynthesis protein FlhF [Peribacillus deserti]|uniref:Flagellar biosynthesis protein FlhF n=1 Tax=Peribacillus deserti TaxID=673318 RepID=A0A2N5MB37_9BACI|nr:flagellar biosynthesis protein FlhF [Peribacillus deserti]PLT31564.1 flagellar biosynthesis protein FlhF [Peribacillus deserti]